jgi:hypothetical protein
MFKTNKKSTQSLGLKLLTLALLFTTSGLFLSACQQLMPGSESTDSEETEEVEQDNSDEDENENQPNSSTPQKDPDEDTQDDDDPE